MTNPTLIILLLSLALAVAVTVALPEMSRPTVPLGVSIPSERRNHPVVTGAIRRYRIWTLLGGILTAVAMIMAVSTPEKTALLILGYVAWALVVFAFCRRPIMRVKAKEGWYDKVAVRLGASITTTQPVTPLWPVLILAVGISLAGLVVMSVQYSSLPDPIPVHYDFAGTVTTWEPRTWTNVLSLPLISLISNLLLIGVCMLLSRRYDTRFPDGNPKAARTFQLATGKTLQQVLAVVTLLSSLTLTALAVAPLLQLTSAGIVWVTWGVVAASGLPIIYLVFDSARQHRNLTAASQHPGPESPDDDRLWKWGMFYVNHDDPRMWVAKRNGLGLTVNLAHPGGVAVMGVIALSLLATIALLIIL
ncbi:MAG: DUF1648 domain-containing protein [Bowdeniella nasicola]|nr:DUF1648 domain-containing protein [Bowdeniella nasicola]